MPRATTFETYAPVLLGDDKFLPSVNTLVRAHLDETKPSRDVVSRTNDRLIPVVTNSAVIYSEPNYYFGRLIVPNVKHNSRKLEEIQERLAAQGLYSRHAGGVLDLTIDQIDITEINTFRGKETLIVATDSSNVSRGQNPLAEYTDEVVDATNLQLRRRRTLREAEFNGLNGKIPIVSLGHLVTPSFDVDLLVKNIEELVEEPMHALVELPYDGLVTPVASQ